MCNVQSIFLIESAVEVYLSFLPFEECIQRQTILYIIRSLEKKHRSLQFNFLSFCPVKGNYLGVSKRLSFQLINEFILILTLGTLRHGLQYFCLTPAAARDMTDNLSH